MPSSASYFDNLLRKEFSKESDRAAVVLVASMIDNSLDSLLRNYLISVSTNEDELFDGPNAPFSTFSAKINIAHRLGLISVNFAKDLHLIRKIRNDFAHDIYGCNFDQPQVKQRILQLCASSKMIDSLPETRANFENGTRGDFLMIVSWMLYFLTNLSEKIPCLSVATLEPHYVREVTDFARKEVKKRVENKSMSLTSDSQQQPQINI